MSSPITYPQPVEQAITHIEALLTGDFEWSLSQLHPISKRSLALLLLQRDRSLWQEARRFETHAQDIDRAVTEAESKLQESVATTIANCRYQFAHHLETTVVQVVDSPRASLPETLHRLTVYPVTGFPILLVILYFGIYKFVGEFGAGTLVNACETFFATTINPWVNLGVAWLIPWPWLQDLFAHDYGIITLGLRYAVAIVMPVVATYFLMFSLLEDSGYLPRLSLMLDRLFKALGLSGRAVIPMVLGLGCDTMATMVTRTLETKRERIIASFLLALAVPCAAQWGVILGLLAQNPAALALWAGTIVAIFLGVGTLVSRILPGQKAGFYMELPPLRWPQLGNILKKTYTRVIWYFWEVVPLFIWASVLIWVGQLTGVFNAIVRLLEPVSLALGLPQQAAPIFLYGFFRRDYGAAGLFDLQQQGIFDGNQLVVTAVVLTLFLPCIAQVQILLKERGWKTTLAMIAFIVPFAFLVGFVLNLGLTVLSISI